MQVTLQLAAKVTYATTYNILAETEGGRADRVVMVMETKNAKFTFILIMIIYAAWITLGFCT